MIELPHITDDIDLRKDSDADAARRELAYCQLILPPGCGRPEDGMFDPIWVAVKRDVETPENDPSISYDVSGAQVDLRNGIPTETRAAFLAIEREDETWLLKRLGGVPDKLYSPAELPDLSRSQLTQFAAARGWRLLLLVKLQNDADDSEAKRQFVYFGLANRRTPMAKEILFMDRHNADVHEEVSGLANSLSLPEEVLLALETAGKLHDLGKQEEIWQRAAGNWDLKKCACVYEPVAKPIGIMRGRQLGGFRHELASLRHAKKYSAITELAPEVADLALHLIAVHHGHGRPYFESKTYDRGHLRESDELAQECLERFARLQRRYGAWGLAYIESLLRAADGIASQAGQEQPTGA